MRNRDYTDTLDFLNRLFGETVQAVELRVCPNERGTGGAQSLMTTDDATRQSFLRRRDEPGVGSYFGVCTRQRGAISGNKDTVAECPALWVDIDCAKQGIAGEAARRALDFLPFPPSIVVNSGGGLHAYWLLEEPPDVSVGSDARNTVEAALRQLAMILAGDTACAELARILRLPGTLNSKAATLELNDGQPAVAEVISDNGRCYDFEALCEWLSDQRAVLHGKAEALRPVRVDDPFVAYAREAGYEPSIDIDRELAAMDHGAVGGASIHETQLRVSMSMIARGYDDEEIVARVLAATETAAPGDAKWNWGREEREIRRMIATGRQKALAKPLRPVQAAVLRTEGNAALKLVHSAETETKPELKVVRSERSITVAIGEAVIGVWRERHGPVMHTGGTTYAYEGGVWVDWDDRMAQRLRAIVQEACASLKVEPKTAILNAAKAYFMDRPELIRDEVEFDHHGLIIADDATVDPANGQIGTHSPEHFARYKVGASVHGPRECPVWLTFLSETFSDQLPEEATAILATLQEWFGSTLVREKSRATRMGLLAHGPSRTGKTQIAEVTRGLLGRRHVSGAQMRDLEGRFGVEPFLGKRGWIADDAIGEGEYLDADIYKKIVTGEKMSVQCKGGRNVETSFGFPVQLTANNLPRVKDQSEAVYNRSLILPCQNVRSEEAPEPTGYNSIADKIATEELTGIFWWAFAGWQRLSARGFFDPPKTMTEARKGFEADNNPVATWMADCVEKASDMKVSRNDLLASMNGWWSQEYGVDAKPWSGRGFFPRLTKAIAGYSKDRDETTDAEGVRYLIGVSLNQPGLLAWRIFKDSRWGSDSKTSSDEAFVNRDHHTPFVPVADRRPRF